MAQLISPDGIKDISLTIRDAMEFCEQVVGWAYEIIH